MSYQNIPPELRAIPHWIVWKLEDIGAKKPTKIPYNPVTGRMASVNKSEDWADFDRAIQALSSNSGYNGIGFVFSNEDDYSFIDLDDTQGDDVALQRQIKIFQELDSYSEISPSGKGLHIIVKGKVLAGRRRSFIEIYSSQRYATFTGNVYPQGTPKPIAERQSELTQLWEQMGEGGTATVLYKGEAKEILSDKEVIAQACAASNAQKFKDLLDGNWQIYYGSQSEADFAFVDIIAFYSKNKNQIIRIFRASQLGQREKAQRNDYVSWMVDRSFDKMLPQLDFDGFKNALEVKIAENNYKAAGLAAVSSNGKTAGFDPVNTGSIPVTASIHANPDPIIVPPGLLGEVAQFIYAAAPRPVPEIALAGAIGLMAGICGRAYNISNTGLNQYILLLAKTGMGKEGMRSGIDKLIKAVELQVPVIHEFIGPSHIASGQALDKYIHKKSQCFVSILGEFGLMLQSMSSVRANPHEVKLKKALLELYNVSGHSDVYRASIHADLEKNTEVTHSPAFSILGESTPHHFYAALNEEMITEGLLPRFMFIEYNGIRPELNENHNAIKPPFQLVERFAQLAANCATLMHSKKVINIQFTPEALEIANKFDHYATSLINNTEDEVVLNLWNRAHLKAIKFAGLIAVGCNMIYPKIEVEYLNLAIKMVKDDIKALSTRFESGEIGSNSSETKQISDIGKAIKQYLETDWEKIKKYCTHQVLHGARVIPYSYLSKRLIAQASFRNDRTGATNALKRTIQVLVDSDKLRELSKVELADKFGTTQRAFMVSDVSILDG